MAFIALTALGGETVYVEPANVSALTPVPSNLLPAGVTDGTYVGDNDPSGRVAVQGTPATVAAALGGGLPSVIGAVVNDDGTIAGSSGVASVNKAGVGLYEVNLTASPGALGTWAPFVTRGNNGTDGTVQAELSGLAQVTVVTKTAGVLADGDFNLFVLTGLS